MPSSANVLNLTSKRCCHYQATACWPSVRVRPSAAVAAVWLRPAACALSTSASYHALAEHFQDLNIEGSVVYREQLLLAQRGNGRGRENALVLLDLPQVLRDLQDGQLSAAALQRIVPLQLPELDGVPLSLTDLSVAPSGALYFTATAEATDSSYLDGACVGSVLGRLDAQLSIVELSRLTPVVKIEGLAFQADGRPLLVADADDPTIASPLFTLDKFSEPAHSN